MARKGQKFNKYTEDFMEQVVKEKKEGKSYSTLSKKYNLSENTIKTWVRRNKLKGTIKRDKRGRRKNPESMELEELRIENEILKKFLAFIEEEPEQK